MGMHYGFVATNTTVDRLVNEFSIVWPKLEAIKTATVSSMDEFIDWKQENERFVSAKDWRADNAGVEVYGFLQDGSWAVLLDSSYALSTDDQELATLSVKFAVCVSFVVETAGGVASFVCFKDGQLHRRIDSENGNVRVSGDPLPEEAGLSIDSYYMVETEALQKRLGLSFHSDSPPTEILAVAAVDRTDYSNLLAEKPKSPPTTKPWWKFW